jgi:hypothetical protein
VEQHEPHYKLGEQHEPHYKLGVNIVLDVSTM